MKNKEIVDEGNKYILNTYKRNPVAFVKGRGARLLDADGKEYIDFLAGIAVNILGHGNKKLINAITKQSENIIHSSNLYCIEPQVKLAKMLCCNSFGDKVFFCNSGTEANEAAIKLARKYNKVKYKENRSGILSMFNSFHGRTMGALSATGQIKFQKDFAPIVPGFKYSKFNNIDDFKSNIDENIGAVILEPIQGEGGIEPVDMEYIKNVRDICTERDILLIFDEVQCGMGRTGTLFAYEQMGVVPDIMTLAKGLAGGVPIGAMVVCERLNNVLVPGDHGSTFGGNHLACSAGCAVMEELSLGVLSNVKDTSSYLNKRLNVIKDKNGCIEYIKGMGLMIGVKLKESISASLVAEKCFNKGLIVNALANNMLRLVPPLVITKADIDEGMDILENVLDEF